MSKLFSFPLNQNNSAMARYGREGEGGTGRACRGGKGGRRHKGVTLVSPQVKQKQCMVMLELSEREQSKKGMLICGRGVLRQKSLSNYQARDGSSKDA